MSGSDNNEDWPRMNQTQPDKAVQTYVRRWKVYANVTPKSEAATLADLASQASENG